MTRLERSFTINAPVNEVFSYISDPVNQMEYIPSVIDIRDVRGHGVGLTCSWTYKIMGIRINGEAEVTEFVPDKRYVIKTKGGGESVWDWTFEGQAARTKVALKVDYSIPVPVLKLGEAVFGRLNELEADHAIAILKERLHRTKTGR
jgi:carbon monoxide dehydrogenase subunit G